MELSNKQKGYIVLGALTVGAIGIIAPRLQELGATPTIKESINTHPSVSTTLSTKPYSDTPDEIVMIDGTLDSSAGQTGMQDLLNMTEGVISLLGDRLIKSIQSDIKISTTEDMYVIGTIQEMPNAIDLYITALGNPKEVSVKELNRVGMYLIGEFANQLTEGELELFKNYRINLLYRHDDGTLKSIPETTIKDYQIMSYNLGYAITNPKIRELNPEDIFIRITKDMEGKVVQ